MNLVVFVPYFHIEITYAAFLFVLQMDEEEKYNRKLESGLYTLQVWIVM